MENKSQINNKQEIYKQIIKEIQQFYNSYENGIKLSQISRMVAISYHLKKHFQDLKFVGFYIVVNNNQSTNEADKQFLEIGPYFSDILASARIEYNKGVCGTSWALNTTRIENDVTQCKNYIACDLDTKSEIVVPVQDNNNQVIAVFDVDSVLADRFDETDKEYIELLVKEYL